MYLFEFHSTIIFNTEMTLRDYIALFGELFLLV